MAGMLIVREAEGKVTNYEGEEDMLDGNAVVASNGTIHNDLLNALK
jgi:myo-inositol-1(or 4)-monophosphatase